MPLNFTSRSEIESIFSIEGVDLRLDDRAPTTTGDNYVNPTEENYFVRIQHEATDMIVSMIGHRYVPTILQNVRMIRRAASYIACYLLSQRRGNPKQFVTKYLETLQWLKQVHEGTFPLFDENGNVVPLSDNYAPAISNLVVDDWYRINKIRVQQQSSTGGQSGSQDPDLIWPRGLQ